MYSFEEALQASIKYFNGNKLAAEVFLGKYALRDNENNLLEKTPEDMHRRISKELARIEKAKFKNPLSEEEIFSYLDQFKQIIPQGSPMFGIGNYNQYISLSNCFVISSPEDSYGGIHQTDEELTQISKRRGGVGLDLSHLRPTGSPTTNSSRISTGIIPFMERYSNSIREVGQGNRRGALMMTLSVHHPQIIDFCTIKNDRAKVTGANISVRLSNEFMDAVKNDTDYEQRWPIENPQISQMVSARKVWKAIVKNAHHMAEPGILFWSNILKESIPDCYSDVTPSYKTTCVNPCAELILSLHDSCRLLITNVFSCVNNPYTKKAKLNLERLTHLAKISQRFMDDIVDLELEHIDRIIGKIKTDPENKRVKSREITLWNNIRLTCEKGRRTGTGITALGDTLAALGIKYGSKKSLEVTELIYKTVKLGAYESSIEMAEELGPFQVWDYNLEKDNPFLLRIKDERPDLYERMKKSGRRNIALLTTAPTGSVSLLAKLINRFGTSSGIEPVFQVEHIRRRKINPGDTAKVDFVDQNGDKWTEYPVYHSGYEEWKEFGEGESPYEGACAEELDWQFRVKLQGAAQKHVDHSISSTINLPESVTEEEVATIYETAWMEGLKGVTVYRKNCRTGVLVDKKEHATIKKTDAPKRPKTIPCDVHHINVSGKKYMVFVGMINEPYEIMAYEGSYEGAKQGTITKIKRRTYKADLGNVVIDSITDRCTPEEEAITRLVSTSLRHGADIQFVVHQLEKTGGSMTSFAKCLARSLKKYIKDGSHVSGEECPNCSSKLTRQEGCIKCVSCEFSKCG
jgi:ribonucleoside-diphosphate reductase alpha chain